MRGVRIDRVFYDLELETANFHKGIANAEKAATKFSAYVAKHPVAAVGALTAAFVALAAQAARMAAAIETNMRKVGAAMPAAAGQIKELTKEVLDLSKTTPRTAADLSAALGGVAKQTQSPIEAMTRLRAAVTAADASGSDLGVVIQGLDQVLDAFGISGAQSEVVLAKLFATAKGKTSLDELFGVLERNGAELKRMGFGLDEAAVRLVKLLDAGVPARNIMTQFKAETKEIAGTTIDAANALREFNAAAVFTREGTENLWQILRNQFNAELIDLGAHIIPLVNGQLAGMVGIIQHLSGSLESIHADAAIRTIETLSKTLKNATGDAVTRDIDRLKAALDDVGQAWHKNFSLRARLTEEDVATMTPETIAALRAGLDILNQVGTKAGIAESELNLVTKNLLLLSEAARARPVRAPATPGAAMPQPAPIPIIDAALEKRRAAMLDEARDAIAKLSGSLSAVLDRELDQIAARARELFGKELPDEIQAWMDALRQQFQSSELLQGLEEDFQALTDDSERGAEALRGGYAGAIAEASTKLRGLQALVEDELNTSELTVVERQRLKTLLEQIEKQLHANAAAAGKSVTAATNENVARKKTLEDAAKLAQKIENAAQGALDLANAFGLVDDKTTAVLGNIVQIAAKIPAALAGDWTAIGSIVGGVAQVVKGIFGGGKSDAERTAERAAAAREAAALKEHQRELQRNSEVIARLTEEIGNLGQFDMTGRKWADALTSLEKLTTSITKPEDRRAGEPGGRTRTSPDGPAAAPGFELTWDQLSATMQQTLRGIAQQIGLTFDEAGPSIKQLRELFQAMQALEFAQFAQTFAGQIQALNAEFALFDITDPIAQLQKLVALFNDPNFGAPALRQALAGLDLTTAEGRAAAKMAIQTLFEQIQSGAIAPEGFGGLTPQQLLEQLLEINQMLAAGRALDIPAGETRRFGVERSITDVQADRFIAIATTGNVYLQGIQRSVEAIRDHLRTILPPLVNLQPPALSAIASPAGGGVTVVVEGIHIHTAATSAAGISEEISDRLVEVIDQKLAIRFRQYSLLRGNVLFQ